jgi:hypothetical protein
LQSLLAFTGLAYKFICRPIGALKGVHQTVGNSRTIAIVAAAMREQQQSIVNSVGFTS